MGKYGYGNNVSSAIGLIPVAILILLSIFAWLCSHQTNGFLRSSMSLSNDISNTSMVNIEKVALPNIVFFLADDQGFADVGFNSENTSFSIFTPFIDSLVSQSIRMGSYYTEHLCTPARAALLTGKYPIHNGMQYQIVDNTSPFGLPLTHKTLAQHLGNLGYRTHMVGKWHIGHFNKHYLPMRRGFETHTGYYTSECGYYTHKILADDDFYTDFNVNEHPFDAEVYSLSVYMSEVESILQSHDDSEPLFLYYAQQAPHKPLEKPPKGFIRNSQVQAATAFFSDEERQIFAEMTAALDMSFEHLIGKLKEHEMYDNTVIIYASDNGGCSAYGANNFPLKGQKNSLYEGGVRSNAFIHSPLIPENLRGTSYNKLFHTVDWLPTIVHGILGKQTLISDLDGINQWGNINGKTDEYRLEMMHNIEFHASFPGSFRTAVRVGNYKLVYGEFDAGWYSSSDLSTCAACCRTKDSAFPMRTEIFNIEKDMRETENLYFTIDDKVLSMLWKRIDGYWDTMVKAAFKFADGDALITWKEKGFNVVPWKHDKNFGS